MKPIQLAWIMYADDKNEVCPRNGASMDEQGWVAGWLDFTSAPDNADMFWLSEHASAREQQVRAGRTFRREAGGIRIRSCNGRFCISSGSWSC